MKKAFAVSLAILGLAAGPALASQCPSLIAQINAATGNRLDDGANRAKVLARAADELHKAGKHAESVATAEEAARVAGITLQKK